MARKDRKVSIKKVLTPALQMLDLIGYMLSPDDDSARFAMEDSLVALCGMLQSEVMHRLRRSGRPATIRGRVSVMPASALDVLAITGLLGSYGVVADKKLCRYFLQLCLYRASSSLTAQDPSNSVNYKVNRGYEWLVSRGYLGTFPPRSSSWVLRRKGLEYLVNKGLSEGWMHEEIFTLEDGLVVTRKFDITNPPVILYSVDDEIAKPTEEDWQRLWNKLRRQDIGDTDTTGSVV